MNLAVYNVFNEQKPVQYNSGFGQSPVGLLSTYNLVSGFEPPRFVRFSIAYEW